MTSFLERLDSWVSSLDALIEKSPVAGLIFILIVFFILFFFKVYFKSWLRNRQYRRKRRKDLEYYQDFEEDYYSHKSSKKKKEYSKAVLKGQSGELGVIEEIGRVKFRDCKYAIFQNVYVPWGMNGTTEIDILLVTQKGFFVIESKNYSGRIYGNESDENWTVYYPNGTKYKLYNPIKQNLTHIRVLRQYFRRDIDCHSIVVFSNKANIVNVNAQQSRAFVINKARLVDVITEVLENYPTVFTEFQLKYFCVELSKFVNVDEHVKEHHVNSIKRRINN